MRNARFNMGRGANLSEAKERPEPYCLQKEFTKRVNCYYGPGRSSVPALQTKPQNKFYAPHTK